MKIPKETNNTPPHNQPNKGRKTNGTTQSGDHMNPQDWLFEDYIEWKMLREVQTYIRSNQDLPHSFSSEEFHDKCLDSIEINKKLIQRIEKLTLYMVEHNLQRIQQSEVNITQQKRIEELERKIAELENRA